MFIGIGKFYKYHIYLLLAIISQFICDYAMGFNRMNIKENVPEFFEFYAKLNNHHLVKNFIDFLGYFLAGIVLYCFFNKFEGKSNKVISMRKMQIKREKYLNNKKNYNYINLLLISFFIPFNKIIVSLANNFLELENDFWFLEFISILIFSLIVFKTKFKKHHLLSILVIIPILFIDIISYLIPYKNQGCDDDDGNECNFNLIEKILAINDKLHRKLYIIILIFFLFIFSIVMKDYCWIKSKYLMDIRGIHSFKILFFIGIVGIVLVLGCFFIFAYIPCYEINDETCYNENKTYIFNQTSYNITKKDNQELKLYYYNFRDFLNDYNLENKKDKLEIFLYIPLYLFMYLILKISNIMMIKYLDPNLILINKNITYFIEELIHYFFIIQQSEKDMTLAHFFLKELKQLISIISNIIYIEIIELKFCNLDHDLKKSIIIRSDDEYASIFDIDENGKELNADVNDNLNQSNDDLTSK